ncbi:IQ domain-containing protein H-like [Leptopilina boulardi]|uniref:IQ domain-containing protein H-like n=1 Tax=Leptopilina boulardi TaxID=63433 RepID=UPI0021F5D383|nr:IQ domain-containing protein H-like [Leptopilina boulardi]
MRNEKRRIFFPNSICSDDFDNLNRFHEIRNQGFSTLCRKMMRWTNCVTKTLNKTKKFPHVVVHLPSFACPNEFRCRAEKTYQSLQNIQIGRLGWLENKASQVLYICPDDTNLNISLIQKLVTLVRPDVNFDNLWIIKTEENNLKGNCMSGCENFFFTPATYRRVRYLTAGRQAFIVPGILSEMDILVASELKMAIFGPCLTFQNRLLNKNYTMNVLYEAKIKQPPFMGVINFKELCSNLAKMILTHPLYKLWFIKINFGHYGHQTALYRINKELREKINNFLLSEKELESILAVLLYKDIQCNKEIYKKSKHFFDDLEIYGGILQACPNGEYHVISVGLLNEHDTAEPLLIATADVIKLKNNIITNVGYIIPQSKIPQENIEKLSKQIGEIILQEQYIGFYGIDIIAFENEEKVQELWVVNVNPYYTDLLSFNDWKLFCSKQCSCCPSTKVEKNYAVCSGKLYTSGLSKYCGEEFIACCKTYYDHKVY